MIYGPEGFEKTQTDRNPNNYKYKSNLIHHTLYEFRHIYGDLLYQVFRRFDRLCDPFQKYVLPTTLVSFYLLSHQHLFFMNGFLYMFVASFARIFSKTEEPKLDEIWLRDLLLKNEKIAPYLKMNTHYVIDFQMEYDKGLDSPYFPEYRTRLAKFFNTDTNTTTGFMKFGDLETGAIVTCHFKTMPYSANQYWYADPFLVYDMVVEVVHNGEIKVEHVIKAEDVLKARRVFVPLF